MKNVAELISEVGDNHSKEAIYLIFAVEKDFKIKRDIILRYLIFSKNVTNVIVVIHPIYPL